MMTLSCLNIVVLIIIIVILQCHSKLLLDAIFVQNLSFF